MKHSYCGRFENVELRPLSVTDIESLRVWRNNADYSTYLRKIGHITKEQQEQWFINYLDDTNCLIFSIYETDSLKRLVGSVSLYNFRKSVAEIGKIQIGDEGAHGLGIGKKALIIALKIGFEILGFAKVDGAVHLENIPAYKNDIKVGFLVVGTRDSDFGGKEALLEITYERLRQVNDCIEKIEVKKA